MKIITFLLAIFWLIYCYFSSEVPVDIGDGVEHFFIAQASLEDPSLFIHHWGKPLFTFLTMPFAQFGYSGVVMFNLLMFSLTMLIAYRLMDNWKTNPLIQSLLPFILLAPLDIAGGAISGLTEPLFNFLLILIVYLFSIKKYFTTSIIASFLPYARGEGQLVLLIILVVLIIDRKFKAIPLLLTGHVVYAIIGKILGENWLWYFSNSPYNKDGSIYGNGNWYDYLLDFEFYLGWPGLIIIVVAITILFQRIFRKNLASGFFKLWMIGAGTFFGVLIVHSYLWSKGIYGSAGLTRLATMGVPTIITLSLILIGQLHFKSISKKSQKFSVLALMFIIGSGIYSDPRLPSKATGNVITLLQASQFLDDHPTLHAKYFHPFIKLLRGENSYLPEKKKESDCDYFKLFLEHDPPYYFCPGDLLIRDSQFGPKEARLPLSFLDTLKEMVMVEQYISPWQLADELNEIEGVQIYQYQPLHLQKTIPPLSMRPIRNSHTIDVQSDLEVVMLIDSVFNKPSVIQAKIGSDNETYHLIFDFNNGERYETYYMQTGEQPDLTYHVNGSGRVKLYVWNPEKEEGSLKIQHISIGDKPTIPLIENQR